MKKLLLICLVLALGLVNQGCSRYRGYRAVERVFPAPTYTITPRDGQDYQYYVKDISNNVYHVTCYGCYLEKTYNTWKDMRNFVIINGVAPKVQE